MPPLARLPLVEQRRPRFGRLRSGRRRSAIRACAGAASPPARRPPETRGSWGGSPGPFGRASTSRGAARFTCCQSSTVGRAMPAAWAIAGMWIRRFVEPPNAAWASIAFSSAAGVSTSARVRPSLHCAWTACAVRRATSSQIGCPDGASAACGTVSPKASATTCAVAAVPRNWQPPPGLAHARQPSSAASSSETSPCANRAPSVWTAPASSPLRGGQRHSAGDHGPGEIAERGERHRHRRQALVARPDRDHATTRRQAAHEPAQDERGVVPVRQRVEHAGRALRPSVARIGDVRRERQDAEPVELLGRLADEHAHLPVTRVVAERDGRPVVGAQPALRGEDQERVARGLRRVPAHARVLRQPEHVARRAVAEEVLGQRDGPRRALG